MKAVLAAACRQPSSVIFGVGMTLRRPPSAIRYPRFVLVLICTGAVRVYLKRHLAYPCCSDNFDGDDVAIYFIVCLVDRISPNYVVELGRKESGCLSKVGFGVGEWRLVDCQGFKG